MKIRLSGLLAVAVTAATVAAQTKEERPSNADAFQTTLTEWRATHGTGWHARVDRDTGYLEMLFGGGAAAPFQPRTDAAQDWYALTRLHVAATQGLHGVSEGELVDEHFRYLPLGMANGTDKITVRLSQWIAGLPVENAKVNALFDTQGTLLSLHSTAAPVTEGLSATPAIAGRSAQRTAIAAFEIDTGVPAIDVGPPMMLFAQVTRDDVREAVLSYQVSVQNQHEPAGYLYTVDANTGEIVRRDDEIHNFDVTGTVKSNATPGIEADHAGNPPAELVMPYINVTSSAGTVQTDRNGDFVYPGVNTPLNITVEYNGTFNNVNNQAGSDYSITFNNVQPNQANTLLMNPTPAEQLTAQANAYLHINTVRDYIRDTVPTDNTGDFKATSNPNINSTCNAFFDGGSVNYYLKGGSCNNTAFTSVIAHELGHWLNVLYSTGNGGDGMGEGNADMWAMYTYDDPIVGRYFFTSGGFVRTGTNTRAYCGDGNGGCYGGVHADGEVWMGAGWKVRRNLKSSLGSALGGATADGLFVGWMNAYNQTQIDSIIEIQWLTLDDDDANIDNGTPNYPDIDSAFREQQFPGFDLADVIITNVTQLADVPSDAGPYTVDADIIAQFNPPVVGPTLSWRHNGGSYTTVAMSSTGGDGYAADIPPQPGAGIVEYFVTGEDSLGNSDDSATFSFKIGTPVTVISWDFEAAGDEGWTGGVASDDATTGEWERGDPRGTAAQPENDHTPNPGDTCWFTGQGSIGGSVGENDVDDGTTTLRSPFIDLTGLTGVEISYWRWYSNDEGSSPNADIFVVQVSNGAGWVDAEIVGPGGNESSGGWFQGSFVVDSFVTPNDKVRVRFQASDLGSGSIVEAAIDDVVVSYLDDGSGCTTSIYCDTNPDNSASISIDSCSCSSGSMNVGMSGAVAPDGNFGYLLIGAGSNVTTDPPGAQGDLCLGGATIGRYNKPSDIRTITAGSVAPLDLLNAESGGGGGGIPTIGGNICSPGGQSWNFQWWYRNGMDPSRFSQAMSVTFN